jgi:hypothetical protein
LAKRDGVNTGAWMLLDVAPMLRGTARRATNLLGVTRGPEPFVPQHWR